MTSPTDVPVGNVFDKEAASNPIERRLVTAFSSALLDLLPPRPRRVLEVGCGEGGQLRKVARLAPSAELFGFDLVLALEVLEHVPDPDAVLAEIARVGTGDVVLSVPWEPVWRLGNLARGRYVSELGNTPGHIQHFGRGAFRRLVGRHLAVRAVRRPFPWTFVGAEIIDRTHR